MFQQRLEPRAKSTGIVLATKSTRAARKSVAVQPAWTSDLNDQSESDADEDGVEHETDEKSGDDSDALEPREVVEVGCQSDVEPDVQADREINVLHPIRLRMSKYACTN